MVVVGIRELKAHLSRYVSRVASGETFTVTDRGEPRALLVPLPGTQDLDAAFAEGWLTRRSNRPPGPALTVDPVRGTPRSEEIIAADRGE